MENSFKDLISAAKLKVAPMIVASICPRGDPEIQDCIDNVNTACTYCDKTDILRLTVFVREVIQKFRIVLIMSIRHAHTVTKRIF